MVAVLVVATRGRDDAARQRCDGGNEGDAGESFHGELLEVSDGSTLGIDHRFPVGQTFVRL
jgi:hypothetical protein